MKVLASRAAEPLWPEAGVPRELVASPASALGAAREFLLSVKRAADPRSYEEALVRVFERLEADYGPESADAIDRWARRHFVRDRPFDAIDAWHQLLLSLPYVLAHDDAETRLRIAPERKQQLTDLIREHVNEARTILSALDGLTQQRSMSDLERSILKYDAGAVDSGNEEFFPVLAAAAQVAQRELTLRTWHRLPELLEPHELNEFLGWARELAPAVRVDPALLALPASDA